MLGACTTHERTYLLPAVLNTRILQSEKGQLYELASRHHQGSTILVPDTKFYVVKSIDVLEESTSRLCGGPVMKGVNTRTVRNRTDAAETHEMPSSLSAGNDSYASC